MDDYRQIFILFLMCIYKIHIEAEIANRLSCLTIRIALVLSFYQYTFLIINMSMFAFQKLSADSFHKSIMPKLSTYIRLFRYNLRERSRYIKLVLNKESSTILLEINEADSSSLSVSLYLRRSSSDFLSCPKTSNK